MRVLGVGVVVPVLPWGHPSLEHRLIHLEQVTLSGPSPFLVSPSCQQTPYFPITHFPHQVLVKIQHHVLNNWLLGFQEQPQLTWWTLASLGLR